MALIPVLCLGGTAWAQEPLARGPRPLQRDQALALIARMERAWQGVRDYTCRFRVRARDLESGELDPEQVILVKFRKPMSIYLKWLAGPHQGREVLYEQGRNKDKMWVYNGGGFPFVTLCLDPAVCQALSGSRHPVTEVPLGFLIGVVARDVRRALARPQDGVRFLDYGRCRVYGRPSRCFEAILPDDPDAGYYCQRARLCLDLDTGLPTQVVIMDRQGLVLEELGYQDLRLNPGLSEADFDKDNPAYGF